MVRFPVAVANASKNEIIMKYNDEEGRGGGRILQS